MPRKGYIRIDRSRKLPVTILLRACGYSSEQDVLDRFDRDPRLLAMLEKDGCESTEDALLEIYKRLRPGEPLNVDNARSLFNSMFFENRRYDFGAVGRFKINKKLSLRQRLLGQELAEDIIDPVSGEVLFREGTVIDDRMADQIEKHNIYQARVRGRDKTSLILSNQSQNNEPKHLTPMDIVAAVNFFLNLMDDIGLPTI